MSNRTSADRARAYQEKVNRKIDPGFPLAVSFQDSILDCDEHHLRSKAGGHYK